MLRPTAILHVYHRPRGFGIIKGFWGVFVREGVFSDNPREIGPCICSLSKDFSVLGMALATAAPWEHFIDGVNGGHTLRHVERSDDSMERHRPSLLPQTLESVVPQGGPQRADVRCVIHLLMVGSDVFRQCVYRTEYQRGASEVTPLMGPYSEFVEHTCDLVFRAHLVPQFYAL